MEDMWLSNILQFHIPHSKTRGLLTSGTASFQRLRHVHVKMRLFWCISDVDDSRIQPYFLIIKCVLTVWVSSDHFWY